jgi:uncharacterized protein (DUF2252 family)
MTASMTIDERQASGTQARTQAPRAAHGGWTPAPGRPSPVALLVSQEKNREPDLVPVRHGRMMVSPFTFYRGAAIVMAEDLKDTPTAGLNAQLCGDAHLLNFGVFGSPERRLVFDLNDFDETLPGPFEYDVKRMAASFVIAARDAGFSRAQAADAALASAAAYREAMASFARQRTMDVWYASLDEDEIKRAVADVVAQSTVAGKPDKSAKNAGKPEKKTAARDAKAAKAGKAGKAGQAGELADTTAGRGKSQVKMAKRAEKTVAQLSAKARSKDSVQALSKLAEQVDGRYRIVSEPPVIIPLRDMPAGLLPADTDAMLRDKFREYRATLQPDRRHLLEQFEIADVARKVVGVGSVGTRCFIALLQGRDAGDPLFMQAKEATASVLEAHLPRSRYRNSGQRVVQGQRMMQAVSDIFLGWTKGADISRHFYWRQLRDMKGSVEPEGATPLGLTLYARVCGWTMARAHARSGDPVHDVVRPPQVPGLVQPQEARLRGSLATLVDRRIAQRPVDRKPEPPPQVLVMPRGLAGFRQAQPHELGPRHVHGAHAVLLLDVPFGRQSVVIEPDRVEHPLAAHPPEPHDEVGLRVAHRVPDVQVRGAHVGRRRVDAEHSPRPATVVPVHVALVPQRPSRRLHRQVVVLAGLHAGRE